MRKLTFASLFVLLALFLCSPFLTVRSAHGPNAVNSKLLMAPTLVGSYHDLNMTATLPGKASPDEKGAGIKIDVPEKYASRFNEWKSEFLSTEAGRKQWEAYATNSHFTLTITVSRENTQGATTGKYKWTDNGELVAATITLGLHLDEGYPNPIYFPVMNSLVPTDTSYRISGNTLAATKLAHEFGHVNRTAKIDPALYQLQSELIPQYNKIFLGNGRDAGDPHLLDIAKQMGGTPVEIWEDREYWGEANAMMYLRDRFSEDSLRCSLFSRIRHSVDLYAKSYEGRFMAVAQSEPSKSFCGWQ
jgi:hypothetical protein